MIAAVARRKITKWRNSLGIGILSQVFWKTNFKHRDEIEVQVQGDNTLVLERVGSADDQATDEDVREKGGNE